MKPETELALRKAPYVLLAVALVVACFVYLATLICSLASGDLGLLILTVTGVSCAALLCLLDWAVGSFSNWNGARIDELEELIDQKEEA